MSAQSEGSVIRVTGLTKHYRDVKAVDGIDIDVRRGEVYGFLGRNGAGKTTTIRMLLGLIRPSAGAISVFGEPLDPSGPGFARIGYLVETATAYPNLTVRENLDLQRRLVRCPRTSVDEAIALLRLEPYAGRPAGKLSLGNKQRLSLARAMLHRPELLVLDEPANALDPAGIVEIRRLLRRLADEDGVTVFMSSHILGEVAHLADRIGIIHEGRMLEEFGRGDIEQRARAFLELEVSDPTAAVGVLDTRLGLRDIVERDGRLRVYEGAERGEEIARTLVEAGVGLRRLAMTSEDLEEHFMRITGGM